MRIPPRGLVLALVGCGVLGASTRARAEDSPAAPPPDDGNAEVHVDGEWQLTLEQLDHDEWREVCHAPCDRRLPTDAKYRIHGHGIKASEPFSLAPRGGRALLHVAPVSDSRESTGESLLVAGGVLMPVGLLTVLGGLLSISKWEDLPRAEIMGLTGIVMGATGLAFLITGIVLTSTGHTKVTQPLSTPTVSARIPTWSTGLERAPSSGTSFVVPILSGTF